jgi:hypothetical protein
VASETRHTADDGADIGFEFVLCRLRCHHTAATRLADYAVFGGGGAGCDGAERTDNDEHQAQNLELAH